MRLAQVGGEMWAELVEGWPVLLSMAAMVLSSRNIVILGLWATPWDVGYYSAAYRVSTAIRMMVSPMPTVLYPHVSHMTTQSKQHTVRFLNRHALILAAPFGVVSVVLLVDSPWIVPVVFGHLYLQTIPLLQILVFHRFCYPYHITIPRTICWQTVMISSGSVWSSRERS